MRSQVRARPRKPPSRSNRSATSATRGSAREWQSVLGQGNVAQFAGNQHHLSLGVDFFATDRNDTRLGFYVDLGIGKNDTGKVTLGGQGTRDVVDHELHQWTTLGGQVVF